MSKSLTPDEAAASVRSGRAVRVTVGYAPDDPVLLVWREGGEAWSAAIAGWSEGVVECVCEIESDFLTTYMVAREVVLEEHDVPDWARAGARFR